MELYAGGAEALRIFSDGNTFIGSSPSNAGFKLDVNGTGRFSGNVEIVGDLRFNSNSADRSIFFRGTTGSPDTNWKMGNYLNPAGATTVNLAATVIDVFGGAAGYGFMVRNTSNAPLLQIAGNTGAATFSGSVTAASFYSSNECRLAQTSDLNINVLIGNAGNNGGKLRVKSPSHSSYAIAIEKSNSTLTLGGFYVNSGSSGEMILVDTNGSQNVLISSSGNSYWNAPSARFSIGTTFNTTDLFRVNGTTFSNDIMTWNPSNDNRSGVAWRLGAATIGAVTPNRRLRVNVGGMEYFIGAVEV
jgi:hypothetical protein